MKQLALPLGIELRSWWGRAPGDDRRACAMCLIAGSRDEAALQFVEILGTAPGVILTDEEFDLEWVGL